VIGPVLEKGSAPAVPAALALVAGILLGSWSVSGGAASLVLLAGCGLLLVVSAARGRVSVLSRAAFVLFWAAAGFASGFLRIEQPAEMARAAAGTLDLGASEAVRVEGVLEDFWTGAPPRARSRLRAERLWSGGAWRVFPAEVYVFVSGESPVEPAGDRGDRVVLTGNLRAEDLHASERDVELPWPAFRLSVKSALQVTQRRATLLSALDFPNRWFHARLPGAGSLPGSGRTSGSTSCIPMPCAPGRPLPGNPGQHGRSVIWPHRC